jgi:transposase
LDAAHSSVTDSFRKEISDTDVALEQVKAQIARTIDDDPDLKGRADLLASRPDFAK